MYGGLECESPKRKLVGNVDPGWVGLYLKSAPSESTTPCKESGC